MNAIGPIYCFQIEDYIDNQLEGLNQVPGMLSRSFIQFREGSTAIIIGASPVLGKGMMNIWPSWPFTLMEMLFDAELHPLTSNSANTKS